MLRKGIQRRPLPPPLESEDDSDQLWQTLVNLLHGYRYGGRGFLDICAALDGVRDEPRFSIQYPEAADRAKTLSAQIRYEYRYIMVKEGSDLIPLLDALYDGANFQEEAISQAVDAISVPCIPIFADDGSAENPAIIAEDGWLERYLGAREIYCPDLGVALELLKNMYGTLGPLESLRPYLVPVDRLEIFVSDFLSIWKQAGPDGRRDLLERARASVAARDAQQAQFDEDLRESSSYEMDSREQEWRSFLHVHERISTSDGDVYASEGQYGYAPAPAYDGQEIDDYEYHQDVSNPDMPEDEW